MIIFEDEIFIEIEKFDCISLGLKRAGGGSYFTVFPISPKEHRAKHQNIQANVEIKQTKDFTVFYITDDWGTIHTVQITNDHKKEIEAAIQLAVDQELIKV